MSKNKEIESLSKDALKTRMDEIRKELIKLRGQAAIGATQKNPHAIKNNKKMIARIFTCLNNKSEEKTEEKINESKKK